MNVAQGSGGTVLKVASLNPRLCLNKKQHRMKRTTVLLWGEIKS